MSLTLDNLVTYLGNMLDWEVTKDTTLLNHVGKVLVVRKRPAISSWVSGLTKRITDVYEITSSRPNEDDVDDLVDALVDYPSTQPARFEDFFTGGVLTGWTGTQGTGVGDTWTLPTQNYSIYKNTSGSVELPTHIWAKLKNSAQTKRMDVDLVNASTRAFGFALHNTSSTIRYDDGGLNNGIGAAWVADTYYTLEAKNIDWTAHTYDFYVDSVLIKAGCAFYNNEDTVTKFNIVMYSTSNVGTIDEAGMSCAGEINLNRDHLEMVGEPESQGYDNLSKMYVHKLLVAVTRHE